MSGYVNPMFRPDFMGDVAPQQNRLATGFNAIWPASNPVGTETTQGMQSAAPTDQIAFMRPDGTPVMQSDLAAAHQQVQTAMQTAPTMVLGMEGGRPGIRAFHGSPYDFERFDTSEIGTGEGAQAYGHGLYFAGSEDVARSYRDKLAFKNQRPATIQTGGPFGDVEILEQDPTRPGKMYEVNIGADPEQFLHWDKPLSEQSPQVQKALQHPTFGDPDPTQTGGQFLASEHAAADPAAVAQALKTAGIPGIRYLDQGSRAAGTGSHNYVVFDAATIDILRKYGLAGLGIGLGATAAGTQQQSQ